MEAHSDPGIDVVDEALEELSPVLLTVVRGGQLGVGHHYVFAAATGVEPLDDVGGFDLFTRTLFTFL